MLREEPRDLVRAAAGRDADDDADGLRRIGLGRGETGPCNRERDERGASEERAVPLQEGESGWDGQNLRPLEARTTR
jgi:hypothetical protein